MISPQHAAVQDDGGSISKYMCLAKQFRTSSVKVFSALIFLGLVSIVV